ncbi:Glucose dehydrogenase [FAD, quinone] [Folsomia candida]|uniref:Glucose dehydrogenase [FAD, quinone] n=1 Tax=Folsomia candida TaxID=158441 RepID=A0A226DDX6_FOLCA|nr:Glucose dehydrogenase [FAD, quinone] [Folsomia candida]
MNLTTFVFAGLPVLIQHYADYYKQRDLASTLCDVEPQLGLPHVDEYDFIVVGGGTAGSLVAGRLADNFNVLLLELGGDPPPIATVHAGRMLGGSGSHNSNVYNRGSPLDFDYWAKLLGDVTWDYNHMLEHFKDTENFVGQLVNERQRSDYYGVNGPLRVDTDVPDFLSKWRMAANELRFNFSDPNARQAPSFTPQCVSIRNGIRESTYDAFVKKKTSRKPTIHRYSQADRILIDENNNAYGVAYTRHGIPQIAHAKKEVIVSAGSFGSPILLTKSGIGQQDVLKAAKIPLKKNVPGVGKNLWDHVMLILTFRRNDPSYRDPNFLEELKKFQTDRTGYFAHQRRTQAFASSSRAKTDGEPEWGDIQVQMIDQPFIEENPGGAVWEISLSRPKSSGEFLFNASAYVQGETANGKLGLSNFKYFNDSTDLDVMVEGINLAIKIMEGTKAFKANGYKLDESFVPSACKKFPSRSAEMWKCVLKRVFGIEKLRVVDASVMPKVTNANLNAATMAVAQKGVTEILHKYGSNTNEDN